MKKALISSISTPKHMESKSIILRLFGTLPVLLRQNSQKSWWQIFPVKKPLTWLCLIIIIVSWGWKQMSIETRLGYFKVQHTQGNLPLACLWQPRGGPEGFYWEQLRQNENRAIRAIMRRISSRDFSLLCQLKRNLWCGQIWPCGPHKTVQSIPRNYRLGLCGVWTRVRITQTLSGTTSEMWILVLFSRIGYQIPLFAGFCIMFVSTISKCPHLTWSGPGTTFK